MIFKRGEVVDFMINSFDRCDLSPEKIQYLKKHSMRVAERLKKLGLPAFVVNAAILHDVIEDTDESFASLNDVFGYKVAVLVNAVTDEPGKNRKERKAKTLPKIMSNEYAIFVKLADRLDNVEQCLLKGDSRIDMYRKEHAQFMEALRFPNLGYDRNGELYDGTEELWLELDALLEKGHEKGIESNVHG